MESTPPLHAAIVSRDIQKCKLLLDEDINVSARNELGETSLHIAAKHGIEEITILLIKKGADVNAKDYVGWTPLHNAAAYCSNENIVTHLLENGADVNVKDLGGWTPLGRASIKNFTSVIKVLNSYGAKKSSIVGCATLFLIITIIVFIFLCF